MRIVRPGSVVGPQQQYMYLKQLEWVKWAACDEMKKQSTGSTTPAGPAPVVAPATPPTDSEEGNSMRATPPLPQPSLPPVTPSRHVATAAAKARTIPPPGQPRKTPIAKRIIRESDEEQEDEENETDDVLPALGIAPPVRARLKMSRAAAPRGVTSSEQRPPRVTRSTAGAAAIRRTGTGAAPPASPVKSAGQGPTKVPRLATTRTTAAAKAVATYHSNSNSTSSAASTTAMVNRRLAPGSPSKLPTLVPSKRPRHVPSVSEVGVPTLKTRSATAAAAKGTGEAWVANTQQTVVVPASKTERPGLRNVRRRRSSFSNADVVA